MKLLINSTFVYINEKGDQNTNIEVLVAIGSYINKIYDIFGVKNLGWDILTNKELLNEETLKKVKDKFD